MAAIEGVIIKELKYIPDERGRLMEILRQDDFFFEKFGQVYITTAYPGVIKAWHYHKKQTDHFAVIAGMAKVVLFDNREKFRTFGNLNVCFAGDYQPILIRIPPLVVHGFQALGEKEVLLLNCPSEPYCHHSPDEYRININEGQIPYKW